MVRIGRFRLCRSLLLALTVAVCAGEADAETAIRFTLDRKLEGPQAPFFVAIDRGYFKAEGLDVTIEPAAGALVLARRKFSSG